MEPFQNELIAGMSFAVYACMVGCRSGAASCKRAGGFRRLLKNPVFEPSLAESLSRGLKPRFAGGRNAWGKAQAYLTSEFFSS
jgi:hypothetical protein